METKDYSNIEFVTSPTDDLALEQITSADQIKISDVAVNAGIVLVIFMCGIFGNGCTIYILCKNGKNYQNKHFMIVLALIDIFACCIGLFMLPFFVLDIDTATTVKIRILSMTFASHTNVFILVLMGCDRFVAVYFPLKYKNFDRVRKALLCIAMAIMCMLSIISSYLSEHESDKNVDTLNEVYLNMMLTFNITEWLTIIIFYTLIVVGLRRKAKKVAILKGQNR